MPYTAGGSLGGLRADLGSIPLGGVDGSEVAWPLQTMEGWDSTDLRSETVPREGAHGSWSSPIYLGERVITMAGKTIAPDVPTLDAALERLLAAVSLTDTTLTVHESIPKCATVRRSGKVLAQRITGTILDWSIQVTAADPRRYSTTTDTGTTHLPTSTGGVTVPYTLPYTIDATTVAGQITATNVGTFDTAPVFTITGPVSRPQVMTQMPDGSVRFLNYSQDLSASDVLVIDTGASGPRSVTLNGNASRRRYLTTPAGWPTTPSGSTVTFQFRAAAYNSTATLTAQWRSAWI